MILNLFLYLEDQYKRKTIGRPIQNPVYNIHDPMGIKYLTKLRLGLSHLNDHKFRRNFQD